MTQPSLLDLAVRVERPWKRTTATSKAAVKAAADSGLLHARREACCRGLRAIWNATQRWPTADELAEFLFQSGELPGSHRDFVAPRLNELADGWWVKRDGVRVQVGGGLIERGAKRRSNVSGLTVLTWRVREAGSQP